jgi:hypothetical protein
MADTGRPSKLTEPRVEAILRAIEHGCTRQAAAGAGGVSRMTLYRWIEADDTLRDEVEKAEAKAEAAYTMAVANAVPKNWQAAAWWLERRRHEDYGRREQIDMRIDLRAEAKRLAQELELNEDEVMAEVSAILGSRS